MLIANMTELEIYNYKNKLWNHSWSVVRQSILDAGGSTRAANKARIDYLAKIGCTVRKVTATSSMIIWNDEKFALELMTNDEIIASMSFNKA